MANTTEVRQYLAHWFQLGKKVIVPKKGEALLPSSIFAGDRYSAEFERCWQKILDPSSGDCYLEGMEQTIESLLSSEWDIESCARCDLPVPIGHLEKPTLLCPCHDLGNWPNSELPPPHLPADNQQHLERVRQRLLNR